MTLLWILGGLALLITALDFVVGKMFQNKKRPARATPQKYNIPFEEVHIPAKKDAQLFGWWIPASPDAPTLILVHGWGRNTARMLPYIQDLHPLGYNLLAFDARNHGDSSPEKHPTVWTFTQDVLAAIHFVAENHPAAAKKLGLVGLSVGGGAAINASALDERTQSVITVGAFSHPVEVMKLEFQNKHIPYFPFVWLLFKYLRIRFGLNFDIIAPVNHIRRTQADVYLIHGEKDETIPLEQGEALYKAGKPEKVRFWIVPGGGHSDCNTHTLFWDKVEAFLQETIPVKRTGLRPPPQVRL